MCSPRQPPLKGKDEWKFWTVPLIQLRNYCKRKKRFSIIKIFHDKWEIFMWLSWLECLESVLKSTYDLWIDSSHSVNNLEPIIQSEKDPGNYNLKEMRNDQKSSAATVFKEMLNDPWAGFSMPVSSSNFKEMPKDHLEAAAATSTKTRLTTICDND